MTNPGVVEAMRGDLVESAHRGAGAVVDADGRVVMAFGDADRAVYPRSAVKAFQALPLVASGAADALSLSDKEIALSCASHSGSEDHVATARGVDRSDDGRALERGDAGRRRLRHPDLRRAAGGARARLRAPRDWPWIIA